MNLVDIASPDELREMARHWDESAQFCMVRSIIDVAYGRSDGALALAERDKRIANALRRAADILERDNGQT